VEVAPGCIGESGGLALDAVGLDVSAEWVLHFVSPIGGVPPLGGLPA
jgi:hypothetical protein